MTDETYLPCGHPALLMLKSAETGEDLYCELCDAKSGRRDAEQMEQKLRADLAQCRVDAERLAWLERHLFEQKWNGVIDGGSRVDWHIRGDFRHTTRRMVGNTFRDAIDAAVIPPGFVVVPEEPTEAMCKAGDDCQDSDPSMDDSPSYYTWRAMIAAAKATT